MTHIDRSIVIYGIVMSFESKLVAIGGMGVFLHKGGVKSAHNDP